MNAHNQGQFALSGRFWNAPAPLRPPSVDTPCVPQEVKTIAALLQTFIPTGGFPSELTDRPPVRVHIQQPVPNGGKRWAALIADDLEREYGTDADAASRRSINDIQNYLGVAKENVCDWLRWDEPSLRAFVSWIDGTSRDNQPYFRVRPCQCRVGTVSPPLDDDEEQWVPVGTHLCVDLHITTGDPPLLAWEADALAKAGYTISPTWHLLRCHE
jgi:hypothetical protein